MMLPLLIRFYVPLVLSALVQYLCIPKTWSAPLKLYHLLH